MDLPDGVTPEMVEALKHGDDVRLPDGRRVRLGVLHSPLSGEKSEPFVYVPRRDDEPMSIRLSPDYMAPSPLWPQSEEVEALVPEPLLARLVAWQKDFDANYDWSSGWTSEQARDEWAAAAIDLESELRSVLTGKAELTVDLWPIDARRH
jgi:hypothetical protein